MVANVLVEVIHSCGLYSSDVIDFAFELNPDIRCFTIEMAAGREAGAVDDLSYARRVSEHLAV